ncbi:Retrovirus-related Pol polyprotein from transposon TNT 1-94 [Vitis vinifera]|uniref:Retrovirus-related Pol polyprotein from transposon TNT 1-94 n=1 Tax=Vitis vinifera TaxID=29760 RepID=A0A438HHD9_VITVI|nr:Retrovirus-related Pol polyprotein from transposon TNT 1-94 [Vitis vinifera]
MRPEYSSDCPFPLCRTKEYKERKYCGRKSYSIFFPDNSDIPATPWMLGIRLNSLQLVSKPRIRFEWEQWSVAHNVVKEKTTADLIKALSEIDFDDEIHALIVLASLPNSWEARRMTVSNSTRKEKLKQCKIPKKKNEDDFANAVTEEVHDALLLAVDSPLDDWVFDSGASFHTTSYREIIQNYVAGDFGKVYLADGLALDVVDLGDVRILLPNGSIWSLEKVRHIPDLRRNLISVGQLDDEGHAILFVGVADASTDTSLWHRRLGHMSEKWMKILLSKGKLLELKTPKAEKLELVHTDLWGPSPVASLGGSRSNNGGEYIDGGFSEYCVAQGIRMEKTIPGTPQQNGVAELMNRTLNEHARSMRLHDGLPKTFWADAINTAAYLINRGPSVPMEFRLPEKVWSDKEGEEDKENVNSQVDLSTLVAEVRRFSKNIKPPQRYSPVLNYLLLTDGGEPECYDEALQDENSSKWKLAMKNEMDSLLGNQTRELTEFSVGKKALHNKWGYRIKNEHDGSKRYKARLVVKGFQQKESH